VSCWPHAAKREKSSEPCPVQGFFLPVIRPVKFTKDFFRVAGRTPAGFGRVAQMQIIKPYIWWA